MEKIKQEDHLKYLILFTKLFIIDLNYWLNNFEYEKGLKPLSIDIEMEYPNIKKFFIDENIFAIYNEANNSIKIDSLKDKEDLSLFYLEPEVYSDLEEKYDKLVKEHEQYRGMIKAIKDCGGDSDD